MFQESITITDNGLAKGDNTVSQHLASHDAGCYGNLTCVKSLSVLTRRNCSSYTVSSPVATVLTSSQLNVKLSEVALVTDRTKKEVAKESYNMLELLFRTI